VDIADGVSLSGEVQSGVKIDIGEGDPTVTTLNGDGRLGWFNLGASIDKGTWGGHFGLSGEGAFVPTVDPATPPYVTFTGGLGIGDVNLWFKFLENQLLLKAGRGDVGDISAVEYGAGGGAFRLAYTPTKVEGLNIGVAFAEAAPATLGDYFLSTKLGAYYEKPHVFAASANLTLDPDDATWLGAAFRYWLLYSAPRDTSLLTLTAAVKAENFSDLALTIGAWENFSFNQFIPKPWSAYINASETIPLADGSIITIAIEPGVGYEQLFSDDKIQVNASVAAPITIPSEGDVNVNVGVTLPEVTFKAFDPASIVTGFHLGLDNNFEDITAQVYLRLVVSF
jgi:hypothetical protein